ncbi:MAG TPA: hypothetical protein VFH68_21325 [Polyangia bacterium]|jgi:hypothetical protein|nr:hypothetical protein [Polyangia bacterium]
MIHPRHRWYLLVAVGIAVAVLLISKRHPAPGVPAPPAPDTLPAPSRPEPPPSAPAPPPAPPSRLASSPTAAVPTADPEAQTLDRIRDAVRLRPDEALALIDALDRAHPDASGAPAEERAALRVDALVSAQRIGVARDAAEQFLRRYPRSPRAEHIEILTGVHPRPTDPDE